MEPRELAAVEGEAGAPRGVFHGRALPAVRGAGALLAAEIESERPRWFLWWPVVFGLGIALYFSLRTEPPLPVSLALPVGAAGLRFALSRHPWLAFGASLALLAASGFAVAKVRTEWMRAPVLGHQLGPVEVKGRVVLVEPRPGRGERLTLDVTAIGQLAADELPARVRIRTMQSLPGVKPGDAVIVKARLGPPSAPALPGDYDFARAAWYQRLGAIGYGMQAARYDPEAGETEKSGRGSLWQAIERLRQVIGARVTGVLPGERGAIATALITGERGAITTATNDAFRDSGLLHILSISGLHMVVMAGAVFVLIRLLLASIPAITLHFPIKKWAAFAALMAALGYLLISGASVATQRSWLMTSIMLLAVLLGRPALALRNVALSAFLILAVTPESLNDVGFQMSFAAVVALIVVYDVARGALGPDRCDPPGPVKHVMLFFGGIVLSTLTASFAVAPFAAYHFHKSQQYAILANLVAIPVCNVIVMPAGLAALAAMPFGLERRPLELMGLGIDLMTATATWVAGLPGAVGHIPAIPLASFVTMIVGGLWFVLWRRRWRHLGWVMVGLGAALAPFRTAPHLVVGEEGRLVGIRSGDGRLALLTRRGAAFTARRWLESDGDDREPAAAGGTASVPCDGMGCTGMMGTRIVAVSRHPASLRDDCRRAAIVVMAVPRPAWCAGPELVIDFQALRTEGTHTVSIGTDGGLVIDTVNGHRGTRPWGRPSDQSSKPSQDRPGRLHATPGSLPAAMGESDDFRALADEER